MVFCFDKITNSTVQLTKAFRLSYTQPHSPFNLLLCVFGNSPFADFLSRCKTAYLNDRITVGAVYSAAFN